MEEGEVAKTWEGIWKKGIVEEWGTLHQLTFEILVNEVDSFKNKKILEAGSGTGRISLRLAENGAKVSLLDVSKSAIEISRRIFREHNMDAEFTAASIFRMPFKDDTFTIVWNQGVLEHFSREKQIKALMEMRRVVKKGGLIITINPYSRSIFYRIGKWVAKRRGIWEYGYEKPIRTLRKHFEIAKLRYKREYTYGFSESVLIFRYYVPYSRYPTWLICKLKKIFDSMGLRHLLVSVGEKK